MNCRTLRRRAGRVLLLTAVTTAAWAVPAQAYRDVERPVTLRHHAPATTGVVEPGFPIDYVGVIWDEDVPVAHEEHDEHAAEAVEEHGAVRFRHGGTWGQWHPLLPDGADAPGQWTSGLVGGQDADAFQVRGLPEHAGGPRAVALNTTDGPPKVVDREPVGPAALTSCKTRAEWLADEALMTWTPEFYPAQVMTVHHTATSNGDTDPAATVRAIYEYHAVDNGWGDIGYHHLVDEYGVVYEGRWSGTASTPCASGGDGSQFAHENNSEKVVTAAHTGGSNSGNVGVALLGDFTYHRKNANTPTSAATASLTDVLAELSYRHGIAADGTVDYANPVTAEARTVDAVSGHRDWKATECPGDNLYAMLPDLRKEVVAKAGAMSPAVAVAITSPTDAAVVSGTVDVHGTAAEAARVDLLVDGAQVATDEDGNGAWSVPLDTLAVADGARRLSAVATLADGTSGEHAVTVTVDNLEDPAITVSVVDLDAHTHGKGVLWDAHAVVQVADSNGSALPDAVVHGEFTGEGIEPTAASCQIDATRCELHLDGLDKRVVPSVTFTVTGVVDDAGEYLASGNTDPDGDSAPAGTSIAITP